MIRIDHYNILLADDEYLLRQSLARKIPEADSRFRVVKECGEGRSALQEMKEGNIQVVFTDIRMPEMDGLELAKALREKYPEVITVILTGYADFEYAREAIRQGVFEYLLKPVETGDLERILTKIGSKLQQRYELMGEEEAGGKSAREVAELTEAYIREHFREEIDFGSLALSFGFSAAYLSRVFTKYKQEPPSRYLTSLRIREARHLLETTDEPIARVGELVGYPDQFYFSRTFRRETGENPSAYRKGKESRDS